MVQTKGEERACWGRENVAIISPVKLVTKSPVEMKQFSCHICSMFPPESTSRFEVPLPNAAERPRIETQDLPGHQPPGTMLELCGWKRMTWIPPETVLCWTDLLIWGFYFVWPLWTLLPFSHYLDMATDGRESLFLLVNPPEIVEETLIFGIFLLCGEQRWLGWTEKTQPQWRKNAFPLTFQMANALLSL